VAGAQPQASPAKRALQEGLADAVGFFAGALGGWQLGRVFGLDLLAPGEFNRHTLVAWLILLAGCGAGKWAAERVKAWRRLPPG
jgi:hypothetical protein